MATKKQTPKQNSAHSAYDDFIHSSDFDSEYGDELDYFAPKQETQQRREQEHARTAVARPRTKKEPEKSKNRAKKEKTAPAKKARSQQSLSAEYIDMKAQNEQAARQKNKKSDTLTTLIAAAIITVFIFTMSILTLTGNVEQYSENENRYLAGSPELSASSLSDGKYMKDMESYLSDQFVGRSTLVKTRSAIDLMLGKKEMNGVYIGKDHFLFEKPAEYNEKTLGKTIQSINEFSKKYPKINTYMAIAPNASDVLQEYMPKNAPNVNQSEQIESIYKQMDPAIQTIDIHSTLEDNNDKSSLYYRTDHHWTTQAAEIAFKQIAANMKLDTSKINYESYALTNDFQGTLASSSGLFIAKDTIYMTVPKTDLSYFVTYVAENKKKASMFDASKLEEKNKYEVFFGGNFAQIKIDTSLNSKKVLMVVKDSYANCLIPMLMPYYKTIIMIDPRYYTDNIAKTVKDEGVTDILWLYNADTFLADTSIDIVF
ncbi:MAG: hypothetical protein IKE65_08640 [Clostridia bacterium]|nr:hypothetical protein [Clostridia bacterium]